MAGRAADGAAGDALAVQDRGDAALADAEAHGALVQAQPLVPVGGRYRTFLEVGAPASDRDALGGQELHDRRAGHAEHRRALLHRQFPVTVGGGHGRGAQPDRPPGRGGEHGRQHGRAPGGGQRRVGGHGISGPGGAGPGGGGLGGAGFGLVAEDAADEAPPETVAGEGVPQRRQFVVIRVWPVHGVPFWARRRSRVNRQVPCKSGQAITPRTAGRPAGPGPGSGRARRRGRGHSGSSGRSGCP